MAEFRRASNDLRSTFQHEMDAIDRESQEVKDVAQEVKKDLDTSSYFEDGDDESYDYDDTPYPEKSSSSSSTDDSAKSSDNKTTPNRRRLGERRRYRDIRLARRDSSRRGNPAARRERGHRGNQNITLR